MILTQSRLSIPKHGVNLIMAKKSDDKRYLEWVSHQPSAISGQFSEFKDGVGRCIACHVRRVSKGSGTGRKPPNRAIPLTFSEHNFQHMGEAKFLQAVFQRSFTVEQAKKWFDDAADYYWDKYQSSGFN